MDYIEAFEIARWDTMTFPQLKNFTTELCLYGALVDGRTKRELVKSVHTFLSIVKFTSQSKPLNSAAAADHTDSPPIDPDAQVAAKLVCYHNHFNNFDNMVWH